MTANLELVLKFAVDVLFLLCTTFLAWQGIIDTEMLFMVFGVFAGGVGMRRASQVEGKKPPPGVITGLISALLVRGSTR